MTSEHDDETSFDELIERLVLGLLQRRQGMWSLGDEVHAAVHTSLSELPLCSRLVR